MYCQISVDKEMKTKFQHLINKDYKINLYIYKSLIKFKCLHLKMQVPKLIPDLKQVFTILSRISIHRPLK